MLSGNDIIYIGNDWFTENKTSSHHIAEILLKQNRILYVEGSGQRVPRTSKRDVRKIFTKLRKAWRDPIKIESNFYLYSPVVLPFHKYPIVRRINKFIIKRQILGACKRAMFNNPILWILPPHFSSIAGCLKSKGVVYYCVDEYSAQTGVDEKSIREMENYLLQSATVVFTVSEELLEKKRRLNDHVYLSLHGVDVMHFGKALEGTTAVPEDITCLSRPIVGFFGLIEQRIDLDLIGFLAQNRPNISFVFIGLISLDISELTKFRNIHFLGPKPYEVLPNYLKAFDVAIMPYKLNMEMKNSNPKKLREYLAGGKPIVSVPIREVQRYGNLVFIANSYDEFLQSIDLAISDDSDEKRDMRLKSVENESWEARVETISLIVNKHIPGVLNG